MGFKAIIDKVGQKVDRRGHSKNLGDGYGNMNKSRRSPPLAPSYAEIEEPIHSDIDAHHTGIGFLGMGAPNPAPRSDSTNHKSEEERDNFEDDSPRPYAPYPNPRTEPAFTGKGLLGQLMTKEKNAHEEPTPSRKESTRKLKPERYRSVRRQNEAQHKGPFGDGEVYIGPSR
ncbi:hypothetical protein HYFRA_00000862 [Hymenoscyphus fraxineus]|uniref:Uncharacterized protein n=1 Tax=Hymenoscyphus fraxineus TaxID=746836 RepID=A0A9N9KQM4_9HELO|nr:hypothetical protein HYFRA_00000862 [Hymenoscyphus fraxineus]